MGLPDCFGHGLFWLRMCLANVGFLAFIVSNKWEVKDERKLRPYEG